MPAGTQLITNHKLMETNKKEQYYSPEVLILEVKSEGVICGSLTDPADYPSGIDPFNF